MLGLILAPYGKIPGAYPSEISYSYGGNGTFLCPPDPQFNTRGEQGLYYDTALGGIKTWWAKRKMRKMLGAIPSDFDLATVYQYTPVASAWTASKEAYWPGTWMPPNGWNYAGKYGPQPQARGGVTVSSGLPPQPPGLGEATGGDVLATLNEHNQRVFALTLVSTAAVTIAAVLGAFRTLRLLRND